MSAGTLIVPQALKSNARLSVWLALWLTKTILQESSQIHVQFLWDSNHQMTILIIVCFWIITIHLSFISSIKQKVLQNYAVVKVVALIVSANPGMWGEHPTSQLSWVAPWLLVTRVCPVYLVEVLVLVLLVLLKEARMLVYGVWVGYEWVASVWSLTVGWC